MKNKTLHIAFVSGALAVALGAFGAHALRTVLDAQELQTYNTGVQYHFYHTLALAISGMLQLHFSNRFLNYAAYFFITGLILFSGSLYLMSFLKAAGAEGVNWLGAITPFGGACFIAGWGCLFFAARLIRK